MRIGVFVGAATADLMSLDDLIGRIKQAEDDGFDSFWVPHISARGYDALTVLALAGVQTSRDRTGGWRGAHVSATPGGDGATGDDHGGGEQRPFCAGYWPLSPAGHRGQFWAVI